MTVPIAVMCDTMVYYGGGVGGGGGGGGGGGHEDSCQHNGGQIKSCHCRVKG